MGPQDKKEVTLFYLNVGTDKQPQWERITPHTFDKFNCKLTLRDKVKRFARKLLFAWLERRKKE